MIGKIIGGIVGAKLAKSEPGGLRERSVTARTGSAAGRTGSVTGQNVIRIWRNSRRVSGLCPEKCRRGRLIRGFLGEWLLARRAIRFAPSYGS